VLSCLHSSSQTAGHHHHLRYGQPHLTLMPSRTVRTAADVPAAAPPPPQFAVDPFSVFGVTGKGPGASTLRSYHRQLLNVQRDLFPLPASFGVALVRMPGRCCTDAPGDAPPSGQYAVRKERAGNLVASGGRWCMVHASVHVLQAPGSPIRSFLNTGRCLGSLTPRRSPRCCFVLKDRRPGRRV
jgi:hypothetical protein